MKPSHKIPKGVKLKAVGYIRTSTARQWNEGESPDFQKDKIKKYCQYNNYTLTKYYEEAGKSGFSMTNREELENLLKAAKKKQFDIVVVNDLSRFGRNLRDTLENMQVLIDHEIIFSSLKESFDLSTPTGKLMFQLIASLAEWERAIIHDRTLEGRLHKIKRGIPTGGTLPFGRVFNRETEKWGIIKEKQKLVEEWANLYLKKGWSYGAISKQYGIAVNTIYNILTKAAGNTWHYQGHDIPVPPLLPAETIERIRRRSKERSWINERNDKYQYLFSGVIRDKATGKPLVGQQLRSGHRYYRLRNDEKIKTKPSYAIRADILEYEVIQNIFMTLGNSNKLYDAIFQSESAARKRIVELEEEKATIKKQLSDNEKKQENYQKAIGNFTGDDIGKFLAGLKPKLILLNKEHQDLAAKIEGINIEIAGVPSKKELKAISNSITEQLKRQLKAGDYFDGSAFREISFDKQQIIINLLLRGKDPLGKHYGLYITKADKKEIFYEVYGKLGAFEGGIEEPDFIMFKKNKKLLKNNISRPSPSRNKGSVNYENRA